VSAAFVIASWLLADGDGNGEPFARGDQEVGDLGVVDSLRSQRRSAMDIRYSNELYEKESLEFLDLYYKSGGRPDNVIVQSWYHYPLGVVPESTPGSMTHLTGQVIERVGESEAGR
jgi:hypothetical protein